MSPTLLRDQLHEKIERLDPDQVERVAGYVDALVERRFSGARIEPAQVTDPVERKRLMRELLDEMQRHPWPDVRHFTREELHERG